MIERDYIHELASTKQRIKKLASNAVKMAPTLSGSYRERAAAILCGAEPLDESILQSIRLNDLRNVAVFEMFKRCGVTQDTYFERYSSPPGTDAQSAAYLRIAHGKAVCTAEWAQKLSFVVNTMQLLKSVFIVYDLYVGKAVTVNASNLNWHGIRWVVHVNNYGMGDLIWNLFLDVWEYEHSVYK